MFNHSHTFKHSSRSAVSQCVAALLLCASAAPLAAQQPPDVVTSDANGNTAMGSSALQSLTTGYYNTASGNQSLLSNTVGFANTATGQSALIGNTSGYENTADGIATLSSNTTGFLDTAVGAYALATNTSGSGNNALGVNALALNTTGQDNSATGISALYANTTGNDNAAFGNYASTQNTTGSANAACGFGALANNTTGSGNTALGANAGSNLTTGNNNVDIGNPGVAGEAATIRIGVPGQQSLAVMAGIWGHPVRRGAEVLINSNGELGVDVSSERFKTDIEPMNASPERLQQLHPVTFHLRSDPGGERRYGLIAEQVANVYPELVVRDESGAVEGVHYEQLAPLLLGEVQRQQQLISAQAQQLAELREQFARLEEVALAPRQPQ